MIVVGIDTASATASVALIRNGLLVAEKIYPNSENGSKASHAQTILPLIDSLFETADFTLRDVTGYALSIGPGSFTGLRVGLSTVKGLAYGWGVPVVGVSTLLAHAARITEYDGVICPVLDARKGEVYTALFHRTLAGTERLTKDAVVSVAGMCDLIRSVEPAVSCLLVGDTERVRLRLLSDSLNICVLANADNGYPSVAATVARLSESRFRSNDVDELGSLTPVYMRSTEAELKRRGML